VGIALAASASGDETFEEGVRREVPEELGIGVQVGEEFAVVAHAYSHFTTSESRVSRKVIDVP
jgi:8-oxo-dGTP pyrophosphatase MutT (NUDIX family)